MIRVSRTFLLFSFFASCGPGQQVVQMDPLHFAATRTDEGIRVDLLEPEVLFNEGLRAFDEKRHEEAGKKFSLILGHFGDSRFAKPALYNRGMAMLKLGKPPEAAADFKGFIERYPGDPDVPDAWLRLGQAWGDAGEWEKAVEALGRRVAMEPLTLTQEVETRARLARAARMMGRYNEAQEEARRVMTLHDKHATLPEMDGNYFAAMASIEEAESFRDLFCRIKFVLPVDRMEKDLIDKATLFLKAQAGYMRTIRLRNTYWGVVAGIRVGRLYEDFYQDVMNAEVPPELTADEVSAYEDELKRQVRPMLAKAVAAYERNLAVARMYGATDEWFGDTRERLERLRKLLGEPAGVP